MNMQWVIALSFSVEISLTAAKKMIGLVGGFG